MPSKTTKNKIITPRPYLSWSQLSLWEKSPYEYAKHYIYGATINNPHIELGKKLAEVLEKGWEDEEDFDIKNLDIELARILLPTYPEKEVELKAEVDGVPILGKLDGFDRDRLIIGEYKTGIQEWTQERVDNHGQLTFYALLVYLNFGKLPSQINLYWIPVRYDGYDIVLSDNTQIFETKRTMKDLLDMGVRIKRAWEGIKELCKQEYDATNIIS
jgi:hypothetical protein